MAVPFGAMQQYGARQTPLKAMAKQLDVQQQAAQVLAQINQATSVGAAMPRWLRLLLQAHDLSPRGGILVRHGEWTEQEGNLHTGLWLTDSKEFWDFAVMVSREGEQTLEMEAFKSITAGLPVSESLPGTGPSFAHLALQVLKSIRAAPSGPALEGEGASTEK